MHSARRHRHPLGPVAQSNRSVSAFELFGADADHGRIGRLPVRFVSVRGGQPGDRGQRVESGVRSRAAGQRHRDELSGWDGSGESVQRLGVGQVRAPTHADGAGGDSSGIW